MKPTPTIRVWLGGSFDPVHVGHVAMLQHVHQRLRQAVPDLPIVASFLPTAGSPLKASPTANAHRLAMLQLVLAKIPYLTLDDSEIHQPPPVYTINTLITFAKRYPNDIRIFVLGDDSASNLARWRRGDELLDWANLWIIARAGQNDAATPSIDKALRQFFSPQQNIIAEQTLDLINTHKNLILIDDFMPPTTASRDIRAWLADLGQANLAPTDHAMSRDVLLTNLHNALPPAVLAYIRQHNLYGVNCNLPTHLL